MSGRIEDSLSELKSMPELEPPPGLEKATLAAMAAASAPVPAVARERHLLRAAAAVVAVGVGAWLAISAVSVEESVEITDAAPVNEALFVLSEQSMRLEEMLAFMPPARSVMRADTASTIVGLEDRIAWIDAELSRPESGGTPLQYREALMRDRVEVMNALVNVRYAQSRAFIY